MLKTLIEEGGFDRVLDKVSTLSNTILLSPIYPASSNDDDCLVRDGPQTIAVAGHNGPLYDIYLMLFHASAIILFMY